MPLLDGKSDRKFGLIVTIFPCERGNVGDGVIKADHYITILNVNLQPH